MAAKFGWRKTPNLTRGLGTICTLNMYIQSVYVYIYILYIYLEVYTKSERHKQMYMYVCIDDRDIKSREVKF